MPRYIVRHGVMRHLGLFSGRASDELVRGTQVIARTNRGLETGEVLCEATDEAIGQLNDPRKGQIQRVMSDDDRREVFRLLEQQRREFETCRRIIGEQQLAMQLVDVEHLYGGERVVVYYLAEERVDFRELVKILAREFQTRIEMRQIGVRDEAKLLADYGGLRQTGCAATRT